MPSVWRSGAARATLPTRIEPPAPATLSTRTVPPRLAVMRSERTRAMASVGPPAEAGTIMVTGREGQDWALAGDAAARATTLAATRSHRRGGVLVSPARGLAPARGAWRWP